VRSQVVSHRPGTRTAPIARVKRPIGPHALAARSAPLGQTGASAERNSAPAPHARPATTLTRYDIGGDALKRHASDQVAGFLAGWAS